MTAPVVRSKVGRRRRWQFYIAPRLGGLGGEWCNCARVQECRRSTACVTHIAILRSHHTTHNPRHRHSIAPLLRIGFPRVE